MQEVLYMSQPTTPTSHFKFLIAFQFNFVIAKKCFTYNFKFMYLLFYLDKFYILNLILSMILRYFIRYNY